MHLNLTVYKDSNTSWHRDLYLPEGTTGNVSIPYDSLVNDLNLPIDFSNVGAIVLELGGLGCPSSDIRINSLRTDVPEPSTLVLLASLAAVFFGLKRRGPLA